MFGKSFDFRRIERKRYRVPDWFSRLDYPDEESMGHWRAQYHLFKRGKEYEIPEWTMRMPSSELHQLMAKEFWDEVPKDFKSILDVGCSDGYMVKHFKDSGKDATGIDDVLFPTDFIYIDEHELKVSEMDMNAMQAQLDRNMKGAKQKDRMRTKLAERKAQKEASLKRVDETEGIENLVFSTGENVEKSARQPEAGKKKKKKNNKKKKGKK